MQSRRIHRPIEILLAEDNAGDVRLTQEAFKEGKILNQLHVVGDGVEALAFLRQEGEYKDSPRPDLILLDLNMHANCYVSKPVDFDQFMRVVRSIQAFWLTVVMLPME
jgi:chemotaxis family two-component system response regulator Rcp1